MSDPTITHSFVSGIADGPDTTQVRPSDWNDEHTFNNGATIPKLIRKTSDQTVNNSSALQDDTQLLLPVAASEVWWYEINVYFDTAANADFKCQMTGPSGSLIYAHTTGFDSSGTIYPDSLSTSSQVFDHAGTAVGTVRHARLKGVIANGATPGNLQLRWAQQAAQTSDTKVLTNSTVIAYRLA